MRAEHPLLTDVKTGAPSLLHYPWVLPPRGTPLRECWEDMMSAAGKTPPHVAAECGSVQTALRLLMKSNALTLLSPAQLDWALDVQILFGIRPPTPVARTVGIVTRKGWQPTTGQIDFIKLLRKVGQKIGRRTTVRGTMSPILTRLHLT